MTYNIANHSQKNKVHSWMSSTSESSSRPSSQDLDRILDEALGEFAQSNPSLDSQRVSTERLSIADNVGKVPAVAAFMREPPRAALSDLMGQSSKIKQQRLLFIAGFLQVTDFLKLPEEIALLAIHLILKFKQEISIEQVNGICQFFNQDLTKFEAFLKMDRDSNLQFDAMTRILPKIRKRNFKNLMEAIYKFAFTIERFEKLQTHNDEISLELHNEMLLFESKFRSDTIRENLTRFKKSGSTEYQKWLESRMAGSETLRRESNVGVKKCWEKTDEKRSQWAATHRNLTVQCICNMNNFLARNELEEDVVKHRGKIKPDRLKQSLMSNFDDWLAEEQAKCSEGKKSVILTAAQAYQRLVSIHPFYGVNGRTARLTMDYILERFGLPPVALGRDVMDATVCTQAKVPGKGEAYVKKVFGAVQKDVLTIRNVLAIRS